MLLVLYGFALTLLAHVLARIIGNYFPRLPVVVIAMFIVLGLLWLVQLYTGWIYSGPALVNAINRLPYPCRPEE